MKMKLVAISLLFVSPIIFALDKNSGQESLFRTQSQRYIDGMLARTIFDNHTEVGKPSYATRPAQFEVDLNIDDAMTQEEFWRNQCSESILRALRYPLRVTGYLDPAREADILAEIKPVTEFVSAVYSKEYTEKK